LITYGFYALVAQISNILRFNISSIVIAYFINLSAVTHYSIAARLNNYFSQLIFAALGVIRPVFAQYHGRNEIEKIRKTFLQTTRLGVISSTIVSGAIIIFGEPFLRVWMGDKYTDAYIPLVYLISSMTFAAMQIPSTSLLYAIAKHKFFALMNIAEAFVNLMLSIILIQKYGISGVALATAIPIIVSRIFIYPQYICKQIDFPIFSYFGQMGKIFIVTALGQLPIWIIVHEIHITKYIEIIVLFSFCYLICSIIFFRVLLPVTDRRLLIANIPYLNKIF
jgi:O-antigen/teichoic acid export membrane protein